MLAPWRATTEVDGRHDPGPYASMVRWSPARLLGRVRSRGMVRLCAAVHGADRPGIVATITFVVARHGANIVDLGTRLVGGLYVLTAELELPKEASAVGLEARTAGRSRRAGCWRSSSQ